MSIRKIQLIKLWFPLEHNQSLAPSSWLLGVLTLNLWLKMSWNALEEAEGGLESWWGRRFKQETFVFPFSSSMLPLRGRPGGRTLCVVYFYENKHQSRDVSTAEISRIMNNRKTLSLSCRGTEEGIVLGTQKDKLIGFYSLECYNTI